MGEREKYLETARPNDPTHENIPLLSARADHDDGGLVPVVVANEQHPTVRELRSGALAMCFKMIQLVAVLAAVGFVVFWAQPVRCSSEETSGTNSPAECQRNALLQPTSLDPDATRIGGYIVFTSAKLTRMRIDPAMPGQRIDHRI